MSKPSRPSIFQSAVIVKNEDIVARPADDLLDTDKGAGAGLGHAGGGADFDAVDGRDVEMKLHPRLVAGEADFVKTAAALVIIVATAMTAMTMSSPPKAYSKSSFAVPVRMSLPSVPKI